MTYPNGATIVTDETIANSAEQEKMFQSWTEQWRCIDAPTRAMLAAAYQEGRKYSIEITTGEPHLSTTECFAKAAWPLGENNPPGAVPFMKRLGAKTVNWETYESQRIDGSSLYQDSADEIRRLFLLREWAGDASKYVEMTPKGPASETTYERGALSLTG